MLSTCKTTTPRMPRLLCCGWLACLHLCTSQRAKPMGLRSMRDTGATRYMYWRYSGYVLRYKASTRKVKTERQWNIYTLSVSQLDKIKTDFIAICTKQYSCWWIYLSFSQNCLLKDEDPFWQLFGFPYVRKRDYSPVYSKLYCLPVPCTMTLPLL